MGRAASGAHHLPVLRVHVTSVTSVTSVTLKICEDPVAFRGTLWHSVALRCQSLLQELEGLRVELRRAQQEKEDERRAKERAQADRQSASRQSVWNPSLICSGKNFVI